MRYKGIQGVMALYQLYNMDCISGAQQKIDDNSVDLIITDPPFAIEGDRLHKHYHRKEKYVLNGYQEIALSDYRQFSLNWIKEAERVLRPGGSLYIFSGYSNLPIIFSALQNTNFREINHIIWKYNFGVYTTKKFISSHYHILYCIKPQGQVTFNTFTRFGPDEKDAQGKSLNYRDREDVWIIKREYKPGQVKNKNELPSELLIKLMQYSSNEADVVADFFLGGFSTAKVAVGLKRRIIGFEINPVSFDYHIEEMKKLKPGFLLAQIKSGKNASPPNQKKQWHENELQNLYKRYIQIYTQLKNKKQTIQILQDEFGRGYFAILNQLDRISKK